MQGRSPGLRHSLLSAPSQGRTPQWFLQISIRLQLRGSDGFTPSSLVTITDRTITLLTTYKIVLGA